MQRRYFILPAVLAVAFLAALGPGLWSGGKQKGADAPATAAPKIAQSKIAKVTVYPNSALVTREVEVPDGNGLIELVITPMPDQIVPSTMYSEGASGIRILTTRFRTRPVLEDTSAERRRLDTEMEKLMVEGAKITSDITSIQKNMELLNKLEHFTDKSTVLSTEKGGLNGDAVITMAKYVMEQRVEKAKELVACNEQKRQNDIKIEFCKRKLGELGRGSGREERDAVIVVDREAGKGGTVRLNYLVGAVTWRPEYKLRAGKVNEKVEVDYLANLKQHSGEDWNQVKLMLSTAQPMLNAAPPDLAVLEPILIARGTPGGPPMPTAQMPAPEPFLQLPGNAPADLNKKIQQLQEKAQGNYSRGGAKLQKEADMWLNDAAAWAQNIDLMKTRDAILAEQRKITKTVDPSRNDGPSVTYHLPNRLTVPSRNDEQIIEVAKLNLAPKYYYKAVPVLNRHVYRLAALVNKSELVL
jgi:hypothetical protein